MCQRLLRDATLYEFLQRIDEDLAAKARAERCPRCGGPLHSARYPRKPRGGPEALGPEYERRLSFCCATCRRRVTPPSVRFLGRKVYLGTVVVLVSAMMHGETPERVARVRAMVGASWRTLKRWRAWWRTRFAESPFWKAAAGRFASAVERARLPLSLLERFVGEARERLVATLRFLAPITTASARGAMAF